MDPVTLVTRITPRQRGMTRFPIVLQCYAQESTSRGAYFCVKARRPCDMSIPALVLEPGGCFPVNELVFLPRQLHRSPGKGQGDTHDLSTAQVHT